MKVAKFGGSSVANSDQFKKVGAIITADPTRRFIVVSAPGKRFKNDVKVTDLLIQLGMLVIEGKNSESALIDVVNRYRDIAHDLHLSGYVVDQIEGDLRGIVGRFNTVETDLFLDELKASGEDNCAKLMAEYVSSLGYEAHYLSPKEAGIVVSDEPGNGRVLTETFEYLKSLRDRTGILIIPGFFGYSRSGRLVTFPRGGSDITGSIIAAGVNATLYENFTDVDSVYCANPTIIENPKEIKELTYREMRELSYAGFSVFHDEALIPAFKAGIPVCIKNTNNPNAPGTQILKQRKNSDNPVVGIASDSGFSMIYVSKYLMNREIGFGRRLLEILEDYHISYEHLPSGIDDISIIMRDNQLDAMKENHVIERIKAELEVDQISIERGLSMIMLVGEGMARAIGIAGRATAAFSRADVNIVMINQGSSEVSMMFGVKAEDEKKAVKALYEEFYGRTPVKDIYEKTKAEV